MPAPCLLSAPVLCSARVDKVAMCVQDALHRVQAVGKLRHIFECLDGEIPALVVHAGLAQWAHKILPLFHVPPVGLCGGWMKVVCEIFGSATMFARWQKQHGKIQRTGGKMMRLRTNKL